MSYINEALKKAQREKDSGRTDYIRSISRSGRVKHSFDKRVIYLAFIIILMAALLIYLKSGSEPQQIADAAEKTTGNMQTPIDSTEKDVIPVMDTQKQPVEDAEIKESIEKENSSEKETLYAQATVLLKDGSLKDAEEIFKEILSRDPGHINSLNDLGVISLHEGRYVDAIGFFEKAVRLKPKFANPYYNLACAYSLQKEGEKGMVYLQKAIEIDERVKDWADEDPDLQYLKEYAESTLKTE